MLELFPLATSESKSLYIVTYNKQVHSPSVRQLPGCVERSAIVGGRRSTCYGEHLWNWSLPKARGRREHQNGGCNWVRARMSAVDDTSVMVHVRNAPSSPFGAPLRILSALQRKSKPTLIT